MPNINTLMLTWRALRQAISRFPRAGRDIITSAEMLVRREKCKGLIATSLTFRYDVVILIRSIIDIEDIKMPTIGIETIHVLRRYEFETNLIMDRRGIL
jgi:hypothetical protein